VCEDSSIWRLRCFVVTPLAESLNGSAIFTGTRALTAQNVAEQHVKEDRCCALPTLPGPTLADRTQDVRRAPPSHGAAKY
jgi:hypothetical protein